jgi:hypothetical protein
VTSTWQKDIDAIQEEQIKRQQMHRRQKPPLDEGFKLQEGKDFKKEMLSEFGDEDWIKFQWAEM